MKGINLIVMFGLFAAAAWIAMSFTFPAFQSYMATFQQWNALQTENSDLTVLRDQIKKIKIGDIQNYAQSFDYYLPKEYRPQETLMLLKGFAAGSGITITDIKMNQLASGVATSTPGAASAIVTPLGTTQLTLTIAGQYDGVKKFLGYLETSARLFDVSSVVFGNGDKGFSATVVATTYYLK